MRRILQGRSSDLDKDIKEELDRIKDDIDYLFELISPEPPELISLDNYDYGITMQITEEIYEEMLKYIENKNHLFIGIS